MTTIVVKNLPEHLHAQLKQRAEQNHRSMNKEVVHLIEAGLEGDAASASMPKPMTEPVPRRSGRSLAEIEAAIAERMPEPNQATDGRAALRAALIKQSDGSYFNVLGIEDDRFFETLERIRAEAQAPDVSGLFDGAA